MAEHESTVDYKNLIRDFAEMYPYPVPEVVLIEILANALDAKAHQINIDFDFSKNRLVITDDGEGMSSAQFERYHDIAAGLKSKGSGGIGFAGVGAKISFNVADSVITETIGKTFKGGSKWYLRNDRKLIWEDTVVDNIKQHGTRVEVHFRGLMPVFNDESELRQIVLRHYLPLTDPMFLQFYKQQGIYPEDLSFIVNGKQIELQPAGERFVLEHRKKIIPKKSGKRYALGVLGLAKSEYPLIPDCAGVFLCTHGKVITEDMLNQYPRENATRIFGLVEVPEFIKFLTTSKAAFNKKSNGREFNQLYVPIRDEFVEWLKEIGISTIEASVGTEAACLERELRKLSEQIPELGEFFGVYSKTQSLRQSQNGSLKVALGLGVPDSLPFGEGTSSGEESIPTEGIAITPLPKESNEGTGSASPISRKARKGPRIGFAELPDDIRLGWVDGNIVLINSGHPAYVRKARSATLKRAHNMFSVGTAIQKYLIENSEKPDPNFIDRLLSAWGQTS